MRRFAGILAVILVILAIEAAIGFALLVMAIEENCDNGIDRWQCNGTLQDILGAAFVLVPLAAVLIALVAVKRRGQARSRPGQVDGLYPRGVDARRSHAHRGADPR